MKVGRLAVVIVGSALCVAGAVACTAFSSDDPPAAAPDDVDVESAEGRVDAGEDATDAHVAAFCVMHADSPHCTDFDSENPVSYGYQAMVGIVTRDEGRSVSPPAAARFVQKSGESYLGRKLSDDPAFAFAQRLSFELAPPELDASAKSYDVIVASVDQGGSEGCAFDIESFGAAARLTVRHAPADDSGAVTTNENIQLLAFPAGGRFNAVELLLTTTPNGVRAVVRIQQVPALDHVFRCPKLSTGPTLRVGLIAAGGAPAQEGTAYFDNVLFAAK